MKYFSKLLDGIQKVYKFLIIVAMAIFTVVIILSVIWRYALGNPITWSEQLCRFMFVWAIMLGIPIYYREGLATYLDLLVEKFPEGIKKTVSIIMDILVVLFGAFYGYSSLLYIMQAGATKFQGLGLPSGFVYASELACSIFLVLCAIESILKKIISFNKSETGKGGSNK